MADLEKQMKSCLTASGGAGAIVAARCNVHHLTISVSAAATVDITDGSGGAVLHSITTTGADVVHCPFPSPIAARTGVFAVTSAGTVNVAVGYNLEA